MKSLWFKVVGAFVGVMVVTLVVLLGALSVTTQRAFDTFLSSSGTEVGRLLSEAVMFESRAPVLRERIELPPSPEVAAPEVTWDGPPGDWEFADGRRGELAVERLAPLTESVQGVTRREGDLFLGSIQRAALFSFALAAVLAIGAGTWLFRHITQPLGLLRNAATQIADGDLSARIPVRSGDEVGRVASAFNQMAGRLESQEQLRRQMVADVAHELRTPLSIMRGNLEAMLDGLIRPEPDEIAGLHEEVLQLGRLVEDLRLLSLADAGELGSQPQTLEAGALAADVVRRMAPLAEAKAVRLLAVPNGGPVHFRGDAAQLQRVLANLVDNAVRYTPPGEQVTVATKLRDAALHFTVTDAGPGIPPGDLPYLFERFWRGDQSRSRGAGGSGLGLPIVRQLVALHGGDVWAENTSRGARFVVRLPLDTFPENEHGP